MPIDLSSLKQSPPEDTERIRLLVCNLCQTIEELPMHTDRDDPDSDFLLQGLLDRHGHKTLSLGGERPDAKLLDVETRHWHDETSRKEIIERVRSEEGHTGLDDQFYDTRNTYREEAAKCFEQHGRPTAEDGCIDFRDKDKRITNPLQQRDEISELTRAQQESMRDLRKNTKMYICYYCVAGETEVVTREGLRPIRDLAAEGSASLLVPKSSRWGPRSRLGSFREVEVQSLGDQPLHEVWLHRDGEKSVRTTAEHRWVLEDGSWKQTSELVPGDRLLPLNATPARGLEHEIPMAVAQGFVYGDGTVGHGERPSTLTIYGEKDKALLSYFSMFEPRQINDPRGDGMAWFVYGLPRHWKDAPPISESRSYLFSWLAGYFAADGTVSSAGQATISSARRESLEFVRSLAAVCGVRTGLIQTKMRIGMGTESTPLHQITVNVRDLPEWFWTHDHHRERVEQLPPTGRQARCWTVQDIVDTGVTEEVFCPVVPGQEAFGLADGLMTGNCPYFSDILSKKRAPS